MRIPTTLLPSILVVLLRGRGVSGLSFQLPAQATECFTFKAEPDSEVSGSFEVIPDSTRRFSFTIAEAGENLKNPKKILSFYDVAKKTWDFSVASERSDPRYEMCFANSERSPLIISFSFKPLSTQFADVATTDKTSELGAVMADIQAKVSEMRAQLDYAMRRKEVHALTMESTKRRVTWWSGIKLCVVLGLIVLQINYLRSFFEFKSIV